MLTDMADPTSSAQHDRIQLAGMALANGVLIVGPTAWVAVTRSPDGDVSTTTRSRPDLDASAAAVRIPVLRGPLRLAALLATLPQVRRAAPQARLAVETAPVLVGMLASTLGTRLVKRTMGSGPGGELVAGVASLGLSVATMRGGELMRWHGAEHKSIAGYERGVTSSEASRIHPRCGTQLALPMLVLTTLATQVALRLAPGSPRAARTIGQIAGIGLATELLRATQRGHGGALGAAFQRGGYFLQRHATTAEPTQAQLDAVDVARDELLAIERDAARSSS